MAPHDRRIADTHGLGRPHIVQVAAFEKLKPHHAHQTRPAKYDQNEHQQPEIRRQKPRQNDENEESWDATVNLKHALKQQIQPTAEITLGRADGDADRAGDDDVDKAKDEADPDAVD